MLKGRCLLQSLLLHSLLLHSLLLHVTVCLGASVVNVSPCAIHQSLLLDIVGYHSSYTTTVYLILVQVQVEEHEKW